MPYISATIALTEKLMRELKTKDFMTPEGRAFSFYRGAFISAYLRCKKGDNTEEIITFCDVAQAGLPASVCPLIKHHRELHHWIIVVACATAVKGLPLDPAIEQLEEY